MVGGDAVSQYGDDGSIAQLQTLCTTPTITFNLFTIRDQMVPPHLNKTKILRKKSDVTKTPKEPTNALGAT